jgi:hypothetical protein
VTGTGRDLELPQPGQAVERRSAVHDPAHVEPTTIIGGHGVTGRDQAGEHAALT